MKRKILSYISICIVACVVVGATTFYYIEQQKSPGVVMGMVTLGCELPKEQPTLPILGLQSEIISNEAEAEALAIKYFPQFENGTFIESDMTPFLLKIEHIINNETVTNLHLYDEVIEMYYSGGFIYHMIYRSNRPKGLVNPSEFPQEEAIQIAEDFISEHGGLDNFQLVYIHPMATYYPNGTLIGIDGYVINYERLYNGIPVSGGDGIRVDVMYNGDVTYFYRVVRPILREEDVVKMISASQAFDALTTAPIIGPATITEIDVCYYGSFAHITQEYMNPTWRFKMEGGNYLYVDGVTGECL